MKQPGWNFPGCIRCDMCRLLFVKSKPVFSCAENLKKFAETARNSKEFQGDGWGCSYLANGKWQIYKKLVPVWEDNLDQFPVTNLLVAHARSAFREHAIVVENNMPFSDGRFVFIFNGELRGVRIKEDGRTGAEKIFNFVKRFHQGDMLAAINKAYRVIEKRCEYIRAMNLIIADNDEAFLGTVFNEDADYFTMHYKQNNDHLIIASDAFQGENDWQAVANNTIRRI